MLNGLLDLRKRTGMPGLKPVNSDGFARDFIFASYISVDRAGVCVSLRPWMMTAPAIPLQLRGTVYAGLPQVYRMTFCTW